MNVIDRVKELLATANGEEHGLFREDSDWGTIKGSKRQWALRAAKKKLYDIAPVLAQALVASQEALVLGLCTCDYLQDTCPLHSEYIERQIKESWTNEKAIQRVTAARAAVRLDGLAKAMER